MRRPRIPAEAAAAADRIAARLKGDPVALERLAHYVEEKAAEERAQRARASDPSRPASEILREAILESGLSARELARRTGVQASALSRFLSGELGLTLTSFEKLAPELGLSVVRRVRKSPKR